MDQSYPNMLAPRVSQRFLNFPVARKRRLWVWKPSPSRSWTESLMEQYFFWFHGLTKQLWDLGRYGIQKNCMEWLLEFGYFMIVKTSCPRRSATFVGFLFFPVSKVVKVLVAQVIFFWNWSIYYPFHVDNNFMKLTCVLSMSCAQVGKLDPSIIHFMWQTQKMNLQLFSF